MRSVYTLNETTTWPAHRKMGPAGKVERAVEFQWEERLLGPMLLRKGFMGEVGTSAGPRVLSRTGTVKGRRKNSRLG